MSNSQIIQKIQKLKGNSTFLTLKGYKSSSGEVANYSLVFNASYENALNRSIHILNQYTPVGELEVKAKEELLTSFKSSLTKIKSEKDEDDSAYTRFYDSSNKLIKGVKLNNKSDSLYLYGFIVHKRVLESGNSKTVSKQDFTKVKDRLRDMCPVSKYCQFKLDKGHVSEINVQKTSLLK